MLRGSALYLVNAMTPIESRSDYRCSLVAQRPHLRDELNVRLPPPVTPILWPGKGPLRGKKGCSCPRRRRPLSLGEPTVAQPPGEGPSAANVCWSRCRQNAVTLVGGRSRPEARFAQVRQGVIITACSRRFGQKT